MTIVTQYSFTSGVVAPELFARTDVNKYGIALATLKNGFVRPTGGISNRAGLEFICEVKDSSKIARLFPFRFNQSQQYIIEAGTGYFRYVQNGGQVVDSSSKIVETATSFTSSELFSLKYAQTADVLTLCSQNRIPQELSRISNTDWEIADITIEPTIDAPQNLTATHAGTKYSNTTTLNYKVSAIKADTYEESLPSGATADVPASILGGWMSDEYVSLSWGAVDNAVEYFIYKSDGGGAYQYVGKTEKTSFKDTGISPDASTTIPIFKDPFDPSIVPDMTSNTTPSGYTIKAGSENASYPACNAFDGGDSTYFQSTLAVDTLQATQTDAKTPSSVVIKTGTNPLSAFSFYGSNDGGSTMTTLKTVSDSTLKANTEYTYDLSDCSTAYKTLGIKVTALASGSYVQLCKLDFKESSNNPSCVNYFQQRSIFANTINKPTSIFASQSTLFHNFDIHRPLVATDGMNVKLDEREVNEIKHLVAMSDLIVLTSDSEWSVNGSDSIFEANPTPVSKRQSSFGSSDLMPITAGSMVLFVQAGQSIVRDLGYSYISNSYEGKELTYLANHLFENNQIVDWGYSKEPYRIVWCVMADGTLNALTYNTEQEVMGWHHHVTDGEFESVTVVREDYEDVPYFIIKRTINGQTKRYIERMKSRIVSDAKDGFFVDCGLTYDNPLDVSGVTLANPVVLTIKNNNLSNGDWIHVSDIKGTTELNGLDFIVKNVAANTVELTDYEGNNINGTSFTAYSSGGYARKKVNIISGLDHLEGKTVVALADGGVISDLVVKSGAISLGEANGIKTRAAKITVGLPYEFELKTMNIEGDNTQGLYKNLDWFSVKVDKSREDFSIVSNDSVEQEITNRSMESINDSGYLKSGDMMCYPGGVPSTEVFAHIKQSKPLPITVLSITTSVNVTENVQ